MPNNACNLFCPFCLARLVRRQGWLYMAYMYKGCSIEL